MKSYNHKTIEQKWQKEWEKKKIFKAEEDNKKKKYYPLVEFPYPSGDGLHVGHIRPYVALDIIARKRRAEGYNVLYPFGWDAFGLPTENYAIKTGIHPKEVTKQNTDNFRRQVQSTGVSFDWSREINTTDPKYYKWTQWIFLQMFKKGLAYKASMPINWCIDCKIGLANEEVLDEVCERCGGAVDVREKEQWMLKITEYADRLHDDLDTVDYLEKIKIQQRNWIGRQNGAEIKFQILDSKLQIPIFTTRPDTLFGATYMVLAPEHPLIETLKEKIENCDEITKYIEQSKKKTDMERMAEGKDKTGVRLEEIMAINPINKAEIPIFIADYVLAHYGTGAIMAVPAHDERDYEFAKKFKLPITEVVSDGGDISKEAFTGEGVLVNSGEFSGLASASAREKIIEYVDGKIKTTYKLRDWIFSRQRYWGEPIPIIHCEKCGMVPVPEDELPVELPDVKKYQPTDTGESPLASISEWVHTKCPSCDGEARRETDTMPNWAGSSWYYLRYTDPKNDKELASKKNQKHWMPVDWYNGGMEHTTLHLLYSRFWHKFLFDIGVVSTEEPYQKRTSHGLILAGGGEKMSKSKGNVVNPDDVIKSFGADTLRVYEMFMGPFEQAIAWNDNNIIGSRRFLEKVWKLSYKVSTDKKQDEQSKKLEFHLHKTIKKVSEDIEELKFNTAISTLMILSNELEREEQISSSHYSILLILLHPFAPHITEELWNQLGKTTFLYKESWPAYDDAKIKEETYTIAVQINGKIRDTLTVDSSMDEEAIKEAALRTEKVKKWIQEKEVKKLVYIKGRLISIVV